ncbi:hypothetical protein [Acholeplasma equifetale]|uniref:hypothetical protein n=1 Tax=Acholeplasma equifetale TaxID=264634 RepID=UPI00047C2987|nr:hypothetical protein [Acholeplasma equifetale]
MSILDRFKPFQLPNGGFKQFHSMNHYISNLNLVSTETVLRVAYYHDITKDDSFVQSILDYVKSLLYEKEEYPDRKEKVINFKVFTELMYATWLTIFNVDDPKAKTIRKKWKIVVEYATTKNTFNEDKYKEKYDEIIGKPLHGERYITLNNFYIVALLKDELDSHSREIFSKYIMKQGIYYIYGKTLKKLPKAFDHNESIYYLLAVKMISNYITHKEDLKFVKDWILSHEIDGNWSMKNIRKDQIIFIEDWKKPSIKQEEINQFMHRILNVL